MQRWHELDPRRVRRCYGARHTGWAGTEDDLAGVLDRFAEIGTDEVHLIPTSSDIGQVRRSSRSSASPL